MSKLAVNVRLEANYLEVLFLEITLAKHVEEVQERLGKSSQVKSSQVKVSKLGQVKVSKLGSTKEIDVAL